MTRATKRLRRGGVAAVATLATVGGMAFMAVGTANATSTAKATPIAGTLRWDTAAMVADAAFPGGATTAILASGSTGHYPDALAANYLAGSKGAPILLTDSSSDTPPKATTDELAKLKVTNIIIVGGTAAVPAAQETALKATYTVTRIDGSSTTVTNPFRYDTDNAVVKAGGTVGTINGKKTAIVATGTGFADALAAGPLAYAKHLPVIITDPNTLSPQAKDALTSLGIQQVLIVGGTTAVSTDVQTAIEGLTVGGANITTLQRFAGNDRSATSDQLAEWELSNAGFVNTSFIVASGDQNLGGVDALAGGPLGGINNEPILVTNTKTAAGGGVTTYAGAHAGTVTGFTVLGGTGAVSAGITNAVTTAVQSTASLNAYTVTPSTPTTVTVSSTATPSDNKGVVQYTATGLGTDKVDIALVADGQVSNGVFKFATGATTATLTAGTGSITVVNGVGNASTPAKGITPVNGQVTFTVDSTTPGQAIPVVYSQADGNDTLGVDTNGAPTEKFGVGGEVTWVAAPAATGSYTGATALTVTSVDTTAKTFQATWNSGANAGTFTYGVAGSSYTDVNGTTMLSADQFGADLSKNDVLTANYNASGPSTFTFTTDVPAAPTAVTSTYESSVPDVKISWTAPPNLDVASYQVTRYPVTNGTVGTTGTVIGNQPTGTATSTTDTPGIGTYVYTVKASDNATFASGNASPESAQSAQVTVPKATVKGALAGAPYITSARVADENSNFLIDNGDNVQLIFDEPVTSSSLATTAFRISDGTSAVTLVAGSTAKFLPAGTYNGTAYNEGEILQIPVTTADLKNFTTTAGGTPPTAVSTALAKIVQVSSDLKDQDEGNTVDLSKGSTSLVSSADSDLAETPSYTAVAITGAKVDTTHATFTTSGNKLDASSVTASDFTVAGSAGGVTNVSVDATGKIITVTVSGTLSATTDKVTLAENSIRDVDGNIGPSAAVAVAGA